LTNPLTPLYLNYYFCAFKWGFEVMLLFLSILGLFLSVILLCFNAGNYKSAIYLGAFFLLVSLYSFTVWVFLYSKSVFLVSIVSASIPFLFYMIGPMLYWYVRSVLTDDPRLERRDLWHLLPMIIYLFVIFPYIFTPYTLKVEVAKAIVNDPAYLEVYRFTVLADLLNVQFVYLSRPILVLGYSLWSAGLFIRYKRDIGESIVFPKQHFMSVWLFVLLGFLLILVISHILLLLRPVSVFATFNVFQVLSGAGLVGLLVSPFLFPGILYGLPRLPESALNARDAGEKYAVQGVAKRHASGFESDYLIIIGIKADSVMLELQPFLKQDCNLAKMSELLGIPVHHLGYYFREVKKQPFTDYRNGWRVTYAKKLIMGGLTNFMTLEAIGLLSGFSNRNTFFTAFKKIEGISPGVFAARYTE
jgi:AraC-like DNA-binding protein